MDPWSLFWRQGHSTTFGDYFRQGYIGAVADWWRAELEGLDRGAVVLEVGCGNCSLLPGLIETGVQACYIGVDVARVEPSAVAEEALEDSAVEVRLHPETPAEQVPEPDASVDLVASVFGIEYSDLERSVPEVFRLLKPGGRFCALLHHDDSVVTRMSRRAIAEFDRGDLDRVIAALRTISDARDRVPSLAELKTDPSAEESRMLINRMGEKYLRDTDPRTANATMFEFMTQSLKLFKMMGASSDERRRFIGSLEDEHMASHERFRQMVSVALDADGVWALQSRLQATGFGPTEADVVYNNKDILAWSLTGQK